MSAATTSTLSKSLRLSSALKMDEEAMVTKKQGIGSILGSDISERNTKSSSSLRRTLSADMSSTKWLKQHGFGFSPMKKIASSKEFSLSSIMDSSSSSSEDDEDDHQDTNKEQFDIWSSIVSQNEQEINTNNNSPSAPYIHPLVKKSSGSLTGKSLEICTESLGSETGSDGFSSYSSSESGDVEEDEKEMEQEQQQQQQQQPQEVANANFGGGGDYEEVRVPKYNYVFGKKQPQRSFPPPIPSLSRQDGASLLMQSRRDNGRLILEAVSVPSTNNFRAQRQDGRLVLTFVNSVDDDEEDVTNNNVEEEEEEENTFDFEEENDENDDSKFVMEQAPRMPSEVINVHRLTLMMKKHMGLANTNPTWPHNKFNEEVEEEEETIETTKAAATTIVAQSLPPIAQLLTKRPATAATVTTATGASFNSYEYYWRPKMNQQQQQLPQSKLSDHNTKSTKFSLLSKNIINKDHEQKKSLFLRGHNNNNNKGGAGGGGDNYSLGPLLNSCKEPRRSLLFWEPYCVATS